MSSPDGYRLELRLPNTLSNPYSSPTRTTNNLEAGPAAKGGDNEGQMRRSHVCFFGLVATFDVLGTCPTQKLPLFQPDPDGTTKKQISNFRDPQTGEVSY